MQLFFIIAVCLLVFPGYEKELFTQWNNSEVVGGWDASHPRRINFANSDFLEGT